MAIELHHQHYLSLSAHEDFLQKKFMGRSRRGNMLERAHTVPSKENL